MRLWPRKFVNRDESNIGNVLIKMRLVSSSQVERARARQQTMQGILLGEVLIDEGAITAEQLSEALRLQRMLRNGQAAEAMLQIVERNAETCHREISSTTRTTSNLPRLRAITGKA